MKVTAAGLKKLETTYKGYLEGEIIDRFFDDPGTDSFDNGFRSDAVVFVVFLLDLPTAINLGNSLLHGIRNGISIQKYLASNVAGSPAHNLDQ